MTALGDRLMGTVRQTMINLASTSREIMNDGERLVLSELLRDAADMVDRGAGCRKSVAVKAPQGGENSHLKAKRAPRELILLTAHGPNGRPLYMSVRRAMAK